MSYTTTIKKIRKFVKDTQQTRAELIDELQRLKKDLLKRIRKEQDHKVEMKLTRQVTQITMMIFDVFI